MRERALGSQFALAHKGELGDSPEYRKQISPRELLGHHANRKNCTDEGEYSDRPVNVFFIPVKHPQQEIDPKRVVKKTQPIHKSCRVAPQKREGRDARQYVQDKSLVDSICAKSRSTCIA